MRLGRKIYFDIITGNVILSIGEMQGYVRATTPEEDIASFRRLSERIPETVGILQLEFGQYAQDFAECIAYRVNPETLELEFSYPDPSDPKPKGPIYHKPLSIEVAELMQDNLEIKQAIAELTMMLASPSA